MIMMMMVMLFGQRRMFSNWILEWFHDDHDSIINVVVEYVTSANNNNEETVRILSSHFRSLNLRSLINYSLAAVTSSP